MLIIFSPLLEFAILHLGKMVFRDLVQLPPTLFTGASDPSMPCQLPGSSITHPSLCVLFKVQFKYVWGHMLFATLKKLSSFSNVTETLGAECSPWVCFGSWQVWHCWFFLCVCFYFYYFVISNDLHGKFCHLFPVNQKWTPPKTAMVLSCVLVHGGWKKVSWKSMQC